MNDAPPPAKLMFVLPLTLYALAPPAQPPPPPYIQVTQLVPAPPPKPPSMPREPSEPLTKAELGLFSPSVKNPPAPEYVVIAEPEPVALFPIVPFWFHALDAPAAVAVAPLNVPVRVTVAIGALPSVLAAGILLSTQIAPAPPATTSGVLSVRATKEPPLPPTL